MWDEDMKAKTPSLVQTKLTELKSGNASDDPIPSYADWTILSGVLATTGVWTRVICPILVMPPPRTVAWFRVTVLFTSAQRPPVVDAAAMTRAVGPEGIAEDRCRTAGGVEQAAAQGQDRVVVGDRASDQAQRAPVPDAAAASQRGIPVTVLPLTVIGPRPEKSPPPIPMEFGFPAGDAGARRGCRPHGCRR